MEVILNGKAFASYFVITADTRLQVFLFKFINNFI